MKAPPGATDFCCQLPTCVCGVDNSCWSCELGGGAGAACLLCTKGEEAQEADEGEGAQVVRQVGGQHG